MELLRTNFRNLLEVCFFYSLPFLQLMRFYEVNGGKVLLDGVDTAAMTRENLRANFGMVLQDTWLFGGTIAENIAYGKKDATMEEIVAEAKAARVDFFVRTMPKGYDTVLGNDAENISVGQRAAFDHCPRRCSVIRRY